MKEKILNALKTKYQNLGLSEQVIEGAASQLGVFVKDEKEIETAVAGAESLLKSIQSFADSRVGNYKTEADRLKAEIAEKARKLEELEKGKPEEKKDEMPAWAKSIVEKVASLEGGLTNFNVERQSQTLSQKLTGIFSEKKVPESFYKAAITGRTFKDETEVAALADLVAGQFEAFKQDSANTGFSYTQPPEQGSQPKSDSDELASIISNGTKEIVEKQKQI